MSTESEESYRLEAEPKAVQAEFRETVRQMRSLDVIIPAGIKDATPSTYR